jgi:tRNA modification GTPase
MHVLAHIEAHLDFPDEDIAPDTERSLIKRLDAAATALDELLASAWEGRILRNGLRLAIVGRPNAGKSSLLNRLLGYERAIVAPIAGTTRDTIEENAQIRGIPIVLVDTAGMRDSTDFVEQEGIRRSRQAQAEADLVLHLVDGAEGVTEEERVVLTSDKDGKNRLLVWNKIDLGNAISPLSDDVWLRISCQTGEGLDELKSAIEAKVWTGTKGRGRVDMTVNARQQDALRRARRALDAVRAALREGLGLELAAFELRVATGAVGEVVGKTSVDDLLDKIFSTFCLGK